VALVAGAAAVGHAGQARESRGRLRLGWSLAVGASGAWSLSNLLWFLMPSSVPASGRIGVAGWCTTAASILAPAALLLCSPATGTAAARLRRVIDGATITAALALLFWQLVLRQVYPRVGPDTRLAVCAVLVGVLIASAFAVVVLSRARPAEGAGVSLWAAALITLSIFTLIDTVNYSLGSPRFGNGVGGGYLAAALLLLACCRSPLPSTKGRDETDEPGPWQGLPYLPIGLAFATAAREQIVGGQVDPISFWVLLSMAMLVFLRQFLQLRIIQALVRKIDTQRRDMAHLATHDPLTGLGNRTALAARARTLFEAETTSHIGVLLLDLDGFKPINDSYGHAAGDELLRAVAGRVRAHLRQEDLAVRFGGDEFVILLSDVQDRQHAAEIGERILHSLRAPADLGPATVPVLASAGLAVAKTSHTTLEQLLHDADMALYAAKTAGKNHLRVFEPDRSQPVTPGARGAILPG
jgi:diguanylate cyclase